MHIPVGLIFMIAPVTCFGSTIVFTSTVLCEFSPCPNPSPNLSESGTAAGTGANYANFDLTTSATLSFASQKSPFPGYYVYGEEYMTDGLLFSGLSEPAVMHIPITVTGTSVATSGVAADAVFSAYLSDQFVTNFDAIKTQQNGATTHTFAFNLPVQDPRYEYLFVITLASEITAPDVVSGSGSSNYSLSIGRIYFTGLNGLPLTGVGITEAIPMLTQLNTPEPATSMLVFCGLAAFAAFLRRLPRSGNTW